MKNDKSELKYCVLVADDDVDDQYLLREAFSTTKFDREIVMVNNGEELLDYLNRRGKYSDKDIPFPKIIMLDLNMPKKDGRECLKEIKSNPKFSKIPIVIFSTSNNPEDINQLYELGANSYITKPYSYNELVEIVEALKKYWFSVVKIPDQHYD